MAYVQLDSGTVLETDDPSIWPEAKKLSKKAGKAALQEEARKGLLECLKPGDTIHMVLRHVSASGMSRRIDFYKMYRNEPMRLTVSIARLLDYPVSDKGLMVNGCGMDMGFSVVYNVGRTLWPQGFALTQRCDKCQDVPGKDGLGRPCKTCKGTGNMPKIGRNGDKSGIETDGGYALNYRWM